MPFPIDQQILGLQISIDDTFAMHMAERKQNLADVEHGHIVAESPIFPQPIEQLPS